jgi:membrane protease YdiL (CAAX protease family)
MPLAIRSLGVATGIILSALPFAILHGPEYAWTWQYVTLIGFAGAIFGCVRYYTGSTLASAAMHSTYNLTFFAALVYSGRTF